MKWTRSAGSINELLLRIFFTATLCALTFFAFMGAGAILSGDTARGVGGAVSSSAVTSGTNTDTGTIAK